MLIESCFSPGCCLHALDRSVLLSRILGCLHFPESFCFLDLLWFLQPHSPAHFFVRIILLTSQRFVTMSCMRLSPSSCWIANNFNALIKIPHSSLRYCMRFEDLGLLTLSPVCTTKKACWVTSSHIFLHRSHTTNFVCVHPPETHQT